MSKGRLIIGIIFLILLAYFSINLISILYSHHAFGASDKGNGNDKTTKSDNRPNDHPACGGDACPVNNKDQPQPKNILLQQRHPHQMIYKANLMYYVVEK